MKKKIFIFGIVLLVGFMRVFDFQVAKASGGPGATECSGGLNILGVGWEHSVTCGDGYYAKCGLFRARCIENPKDEEESVDNEESLE